MNNYQPPLLFEEEFNDNAARLLQVTEAVIMEECCNNGCAHKPDGACSTFREVVNPTHCRFFKLPTCAPIECAAYECGVE